MNFFLSSLSLAKLIFSLFTKERPETFLPGESLEFVLSFENKSTPIVNVFFKLIFLFLLSSILSFFLSLSISFCSLSKSLLIL